MSRPLNETQAWLLDAITAPLPPAEHEIERVISASPSQLPVERLSVYRQAYVARLLTVLQELFPCTRFAVGDDLFRQFCLDYLAAHPPASYTLARLADQFADCLDRSRPPDWGAFLVELARLELAIDRVFDAEGPELLPPFELPRSIGGQMRLALVPGAEVLAFTFPVSHFYTAWKAGTADRWPEPTEQFVALVRRDYVVRRLELTRLQFHLLTAIKAGSTLDEAVHAAIVATNQPHDQLAGQIEEAFRRFASEQFFAAVH